MEPSPEITHPLAENGEGVGATIGGYRLVEHLGEGGFGIVYRAEQTHPVRREVALKVIKLGMDTEQVIARFIAERDLLVRMEHPGIAGVLDAGVMPSGRPYFVMDLVRGVDVRAYCEAHALELADRLELVARICDAVQHAHHKGVIHRDLKPSNVLVVEENGRPAPRVIDFGIAKAIDESGAGLTRHTMSGQLLGTPAYMSPEQVIEPQRVDTRSDVYALGAILYELVTGAPPFDFGTLGAASQSELERMLREVEPARPSSRTRAARGDLEAIILMAMDKYPERRYASAAAMAEDLRCHLHHEPVIARAPSFGYRLAKYVRRHRVATTMTAIIVAFLAVVTVAMTRSMLDVRRAARQTAAINAFMGDVLTTLPPDREGTEVQLVDVMEIASRDAMSHFEGHPELQALTHGLIGRVYQSLGLAREAAEHLEPAYPVLVREVGADDPRTLTTGRHLATVLIGLHRLDEAEALLSTLRTRHRDVHGANARETLSLEFSHCTLLADRGRYDDAVVALRDLRGRTVRWLGEDDPQHSEVTATLAHVLHRRWLQSGGDPSALDEAIALLRPLIPPEGDPAESDFDALTAMVRLAQVLEATGGHEEVARVTRRALDLAIPRYGEIHGLSVRPMALHGRALSKLGQPDEAADWVIRANTANRAVLGDRHPAAIGGMVQALPILDAADRDAVGEAYARTAAEQFASLMGDDQHMVHRARSAAAHFMSRQGRLHEAAAMFEAVERALADGTPPRTRAIHAFLYGRHLARTNRRDAAELRLREAERLFETAGSGPLAQRGIWDADAARAMLAELSDGKKKTHSR